MAPKKSNFNRVPRPPKGKVFPISNYLPLFWRFNVIVENYFVHGNKRKTGESFTPCKCKGSCLDNSCINFGLFEECDPKCNKMCRNKRIQTELKPPDLKNLTVKFYGQKGFGLQTLKPINKGTFIVEYVGEVISKSEHKRRVQESGDFCYGMWLRDDLIVDSSRMGNISRFANHSCDPNCEVEKWTVNGVDHLVVVATKEIMPKEEITHNYDFELYDAAPQQTKCYCGSQICSGQYGKAGRTGRQKLRSNSSLDASDNENSMPMKDASCMIVSPVNSKSGSNVQAQNANTCGTCGKQCSTKRALIVHRSTYHNRSQGFACQYPGCVKSFTQLHNLKKHSITAHEGKKFQCDACGKSLATSFSLTRHQNAGGCCPSNGSPSEL